MFWPDEPEFVRMAARFGATIVPFGVIGEDDIAEVLLYLFMIPDTRTQNQTDLISSLTFFCYWQLVLDYDDMIKIPYVSDLIRRDNEKYQEFNIR